MTTNHPMPAYIVGWNTPGYLSDGEPIECDTFDDAKCCLIDELLRDHQRLRELLNRLAEETVMAKTLFDAGDLLERHIRREERELFPLFEKRADAALAAEVETKLGAIYHEPREIHSRG